MKRVMRAVVMIILAVLIAGCAGQQSQSSLRVTGESLAAVGEQFVAVSNLYTQGCKAGQIKPEPCAQYTAFGTRFKQSYPLAIKLWEAARKTNDKVAEQKTREAITALATELSTLAVHAYAVFGAPPSK